MIISGLTDSILVIGAWKKINWMVCLWIFLSHVQSVLICALFIFFNMYWPVAVCFVFMVIISLLGFNLVQNNANAVNKDTDYSEMINLTKNEA